MLASFFIEYKRRHPSDLMLAFVGPHSSTLPASDDIVITGIVDEQDKWDIIADAVVSISPSAMESFSLVVLEGWVKGIPALVNGTCGPTVENCSLSGGGLWFDSYGSFEISLSRLLDDPTLRRTLGEAGRDFVRRTFDWPVLICRYAAFLEQVIARGRTELPVVAER